MLIDWFKVEPWRDVTFYSLLQDARGPTRDEDMPRWYVPTGPDDDTVVFESRFESGNLRSAEKM